MPVRPSMGARISVYASCSRMFSTAASSARTTARAVSTAAWSALIVAARLSSFVRIWSYCSRAIMPPSTSRR